MNEDPMPTREKQTVNIARPASARTERGAARAQRKETGTVTVNLRRGKFSRNRKTEKEIFKEIRLTTSTNLIPFSGGETSWREGEKIKSNTTSRSHPPRVRASLKPLKMEDGSPITYISQTKELGGKEHDKRALA